MHRGAPGGGGGGGFEITNLTKSCLGLEPAICLRPLYTSPSGEYWLAVPISIEPLLPNDLVSVSTMHICLMPMSFGARAHVLVMHET